MNIETGSRVTINRPGSREHGIVGNVLHCDRSVADEALYFVELREGPPWRGWYKEAELFVLPESGDAIEAEQPSAAQKNPPDMNSTGDKTTASGE